MKVREKHPYDAPSLMVVSISSANMLAASNDAPEVHTTTEKASTEYGALVKDQNSNIWDENW